MEEHKIDNNRKVNYGLHLLKIVSMFMLISFHFYDHGAREITSMDPLDFDWLLLASTRVWGGIANCVFMLITGYFLSKKTVFSLRKLLLLYAQVWFYSVFIGIFGEWLVSGSLENLDLFSTFCPFITNKYWYFSTYIVVYLFHPFSNRLIAALSKEQHKTLCVLAIMVFSVIRTLFRQMWLEGTNSISLFFVLYFTGAYFRKYPFKLPYKWIIFISLLGLEIATNPICKFLDVSTAKSRYLFYPIWGSEKLFPVAIGLVLFKCFEDIDIRRIEFRKIIDFLAPAVFGVYLFHVSVIYKFLFGVIFNDQDTHGIELLIQMTAAMVSIFVVGVVIDQARIRFLERPFFKLLDRPITKLDDKVSKFFN